MNTIHRKETMVLHRYARAVKRMLKLEDAPRELSTLTLLRKQRRKVIELTDEILNAQ